MYMLLVDRMFRHQQSEIKQDIKHELNMKKPEYQKIVTILCDKDKETRIPLYIFKDEKWAYEAAGEHCKNMFKLGTRTVSYYPW